MGLQARWLWTLSTSPRFLSRPTGFFPTCWSRGTSESSTYGKQRICSWNSALAHFHVSLLSDFIFYSKPLYKSLHQSFFYSFITILPSESGVTDKCYIWLQHILIGWLTESNCNWSILLFYVIIIYQWFVVV
jgi:hypothetical protein